MLLKLAARSVRRSARDYAIYFFTLVVGVAVFYAFNSIGSQSILFDLEEGSEGSQMLEMTQYLLSMMSVVVAVVLGFLIVYANRFLIRRRRHEFGIYLTLGMSAGEVSRIVLYEAVIVGVVSLVVGLACGVLAAQGLSFVTAAVFAVPMQQYQFVFSPEAFLTTQACFVAIYVVVALFNLITVRRYKLIDLLSARSKNERMPVRNPWVCLAGFVVSIAILAVAYWHLQVNGLERFDDPHFMWATVLMLVGSFIFFWSVAGFVIAVLQRMPGVYLRGLTMFTVRQIASKINTAFVSLWAVCVLLFFSVTIFSTGMGMIEVFSGEVDEAAPYDASLTSTMFYGSIEENANELGVDVSDVDALTAPMRQNYADDFAQGEAYGWDMEAKLRADVPQWDSIVADAAQLDTYLVPGMTYGTIIDAGISTGDDELNAQMERQDVDLVSVSQINDQLELLGEPAVKLGEDEYLIANNMAMSQPMAEGIVNAGYVLSVAGHDLTPAKKGICEVQLVDNMIKATGCLFVVPDAVIDDLKVQGTIHSSGVLNVMYHEPGEATDNALNAALAQAYPLDDGTTDHFVSTAWPLTVMTERAAMLTQASGTRMMVTYLAVYIGFVFLIATAAVLAIQQLSEAADSQGRYRLLARLGCDERQLNRSLFAQVLVYFVAPLVLAMCHSAWAIHVLDATLFDALGVDMGGAITGAVVFTLVTYGAYFLVTFLCAKGLVRQAVR